jgi:hypothetical protein
LDLGAACGDARAAADDADLNRAGWGLQ